MKLEPGEIAVRCALCPSTKAPLVSCIRRVHGGWAQRATPLAYWDKTIFAELDPSEEKERRGVVVSRVIVDSDPAGFFWVDCPKHGRLFLTLDVLRAARVGTRWVKRSVFVRQREYP